MAIEPALAGKVFSGYSPTSVRFFCYLRFLVLRNLLSQVIEPSVNGCRNVLDIGCGYGLVSLILSLSHPSAAYAGLDIDPWRIRRARQAASRLQRGNLHFWCADIRTHAPQRPYDAILLIDVLHHIDNPSKRRLLGTCARSLSPGGMLVIKDILPRPYPQYFFTYMLDILVTGSRDLWYWEASQFQEALASHFQHVEILASPGISPYPHATYICRLPSV